MTLFLTFPNHCLYWRNWFVWPLVAIYTEAKSLIDSSVSLSVAILCTHAFISSWRSRRECSVRCKLTNSWQTVTVADHLVSTHIMWVYTVYRIWWMCSIADFFLWRICKCPVQFQYMIDDSPHSRVPYSTVKQSTVQQSMWNTIWDTVQYSKNIQYSTVYFNWVLIYSTVDGLLQYTQYITYSTYYSTVQ